MEVKLDCFSCFLRIGLQAARMAGATEVQQRVLMRKFLDELQNSLDAESPLAVADRIQKLVKEETGAVDPYQEIKDSCNAEAEKWLPHLRSILSQTGDALHSALKIAAIGNIMDYGAFSQFDLESLIQRLHQSDFAVSAEDVFRKQLRDASTLAYLCDNAGEIVFDSVLIEYLLHHYRLESIRLVIRETPFLNDVSSESHLPPSLRSHPKIEILKLSVAPSECNPEIWETIIGSDLILCKGMANFENYNEQPDFYCLFIAKCDLVSRLVAERSQTIIETGDWVFLHNS
jgi:uncharacterized protein with ATP-grasp and redox domains